VPWAGPTQLRIPGWILGVTLKHAQVIIRSPCLGVTIAETEGSSFPVRPDAVMYLPSRTTSTRRMVSGAAISARITGALEDENSSPGKWPSAVVLITISSLAA